MQKNNISNLNIIASTMPWNQDLPSRLQSLTGAKFQMISSPEELTAERLWQWGPKYIFFPHWSHIIPANVFENFECVIFHMTDLPFGRGGSPLQNLIERGIYETQISALKCIAEVDEGPIYTKRPLSLYGAAEEIYLRASGVIETMITEIVADNPKPVAQSGEPIYFKRRKPEQGNLLFATTLEQAFDYIRMLDAHGYPHAYIDVGNYRLEFTRASRKSDSITADVRITLKSKNPEVEQ
ncbi:methionyl-tRNA formyltransferase [Desulfosediminicola sp.]|uniref:methionyl-tRNA formyltransferase n=1 Tax=Desulfosediminicola sp. TaxID=2886825 RepID=UPI003AF306DE